MWYLVASTLYPFEPHAIFASDDKCLVQYLSDRLDATLGDRVHLAVLAENAYFIGK